MPNLSQYQITPPPTKSEFDALSTKIGNTAMGTTATTVTGAISEVNSKIANVNISTQITNLSNIPVNSQGRLYFAASVSPTGSVMYGNYQCYGADDKRTLIVTSIESKEQYINTFSNTSWTGWSRKFVWSPYNSANLYEKAAHDKIQSLESEQNGVFNIGTGNGYNLSLWAQKSDPFRTGIYMEPGGDLKILWSGDSGNSYKSKKL